MLHLVMDTVRPDPSLSAYHEEIRFRIRELPPLHVSIDQDALDFCVLFGQTLARRCRDPQPAPPSQPPAHYVDDGDDCGPHFR